MKVNPMDATFNSQWVAATDVKPPTAANCVKDFVDGGCSSDFISGIPSLMIIDLGRPVNVSIVGARFLLLIFGLVLTQFWIEILNRKDFFEHRILTGNVYVEFFTVFGSSLLNSTAASLSYNVTVRGPGFVPLVSDGVRFFRILARAYVGIALAEFSVQTFEGRQIRIASVTKSSVAVSDGQTWNCVDNDVRSDCSTGSGAVEWMLFDLGMSLPLEAIQKITVVNRAGIGAKDTLSGLVLQLLNWDSVFITSYSFASDIRDAYVFPETCDFGSFSSFFGCNPCPLGTYKNQVGDMSCNACPLQNSVQTVTVASGSTALGACVCPGGFTGLTPGLCVACPVNTFKSLSNVISSCAACPPGSSTGNASAQTSCSFCAAGFSGNQGVTSCRPCANCSLALSDNSPPAVPSVTSTIAAIATGSKMPMPTVVANFPSSSDLSTLVIVIISACSLGLAFFVTGVVFYVLKRQTLGSKQVGSQPGPLLVDPFYFQPMAMNSMGWNPSATPLIMTNGKFPPFPMATLPHFSSGFQNPRYSTINNMQRESTHARPSNLIQQSTLNFGLKSVISNGRTDAIGNNLRFVSTSINRPTLRLPLTTEDTTIALNYTETPTLAFTTNGVQF